MNLRIEPDWHTTPDGRHDGVSVTLRAGDASVCATVLRPAAGDELLRGVGVLEYLRARGITLSVTPAPRLAFGLAGALDPVAYIEGWRWRRDPQNIANARETSLWFSREWRPWGTCTRAELPREAVVESRPTPLDWKTSVALSAVMMGGSACALLGAFATADRR